MSNLPRIGVGSIVKAKKVQVGNSRQELEFTAGRGNSFVCVVLGDVPSKETGEAIDIEQVMRSMGWVPANEATSDS